jgi:hypothetical protein
LYKTVKTPVLARNWLTRTRNILTIQRTFDSAAKGT